MLKVLLRKQFMEVNQFFFVNKKTGQRKSTAKIVLTAVGWALIMIMLLGMFYMLASILGDIMIPLSLTWMYFALMATMAVVMGIFGTVLNMYSALFHAKDNELLLSLPLSVRVIMMSRMVMTYLMALLYTAAVWLPTVACYVVTAGSAGVGVDAGAVVSSLIMTFVLSLLVTVLSCAVGWAVATVATHVKNKSIATVVVSLAFIGLYYYAYFSAIEQLQDPSAWLPGMEAGMKGAGWPLYQIGLACCGGVVQVLVVAAIALAFLAACWLGMSRGFMGIVSGASRGDKRIEYASDQVKSNSMKKALQQRELKRWLANPTYLMNTGLGIVLMLLMAGAALLNKDIIGQIVAEVQVEVPFVAEFAPLLVALSVMLLAGMDAVCTPSVSLEGRTLWILRSLPIPTRDILDAKMHLQIMLHAAPSAVSTLLMSYAFGFEVATALLVTLAAVAFVYFTTAFDMALGLTHVNLTWTSDVVPVKQSGSVMIAMFGEWAIILLIGVLGYLTIDMLGSAGFLAVLAVLFVALTVLVRKWIYNQGARRFEAL